MNYFRHFIILLSLSNKLCFVFSKSESYGFGITILSKLLYFFNIVTDGSCWLNRKNQKEMMCLKSMKPPIHG